MYNRLRTPTRGPAPSGLISPRAAHAALTAAHLAHLTWGVGAEINGDAAGSAEGQGRGCWGRSGGRGGAGLEVGLGREAGRGRSAAWLSWAGRGLCTQPPEDACLSTGWQSPRVAPTHFPRQATRWGLAGVGSAPKMDDREASPEEQGWLHTGRSAHGEWGVGRAGEGPDEPSPGTSRPRKA